MQKPIDISAGGADTLECSKKLACFMDMTKLQLIFSYLVPLCIIYFFERCSRQRFVQSLGGGAGRPPHPVLLVLVVVAAVRVVKIALDSINKAPAYLRIVD